MTTDTLSAPTVEFADPVLETAFRQLCASNAAGQRRLAEAIVEALRVLKERHREGVALRGSEVPEYYRNRYGISQVWRLDLPPNWRVFYIAHGSLITIIDLTSDG